MQFAEIISDPPKSLHTFLLCFAGNCLRDQRPTLQYRQRRRKASQGRLKAGLKWKRRTDRIDGKGARRKGTCKGRELEQAQKALHDRKRRKERNERRTFINKKENRRKQRTREESKRRSRIERRKKSGDGKDTVSEIFQKVMKDD